MLVPVKALWIARSMYRYVLLRSIDEQLVMWPRAHHFAGFARHALTHTHGNPLTPTSLFPNPHTSKPPDPHLLVVHWQQYIEDTPCIGLRLGVRVPGRVHPGRVPGRVLPGRVPGRVTIRI